MDVFLKHIASKNQQEIATYTFLKIKGVKSAAMLHRRIIFGLPQNFSVIGF